MPACTVRRLNPDTVDWPITSASPECLPNLRNYLVWLVETQTPVVLIGAAAIVAPSATLWPAARDRGFFIAASAFVFLMWLMYCAYLVFDAWWFLRFLLPCWPFLMLGVAATALVVVRSTAPRFAMTVICLVVALGLFQLNVAFDRLALRTWEGERRYVMAARLAEAMTEPNSVIFTMQHSGSLRVLHRASDASVRHRRRGLARIEASSGCRKWYAFISACRQVGDARNSSAGSPASGPSRESGTSRCLITTMEPSGCLIWPERTRRRRVG